MIKTICKKIGKNILVDTVRFGSAEDAAKFQYRQLVRHGVQKEVAGAIVKLAMESII